MRQILLLICVLLVSCNNPQKQENLPTFNINEEKASKLISLSINCVDKKFPYKIGYRFIDKDWIRPHYEITPSFYGCWDWHSAVHGHWAMVKIVKEFPNIPEKEIILQKLKKNLSQENLRKELEFFGK